MRRFPKRKRLLFFRQKEKAVPAGHPKAGKASGKQRKGNRTGREAGSGKTAPEKKIPAAVGLTGMFRWRRRRDSNPRDQLFLICTLSRGVPSATRPLLRQLNTGFLSRLKSLAFYSTSLLPATGKNKKPPVFTIFPANLLVFNSFILVRPERQQSSVHILQRDKRYLTCLFQLYQLSGKP